jgi:hypothetical protein
MSLKLQSIGLNRGLQPPTIFVSLTNNKNESINVNITVQPHHNIDELKIVEIEQLALEEAKKLIP